MKLVGQLIWYKDQILRSLNYEPLQQEVDMLKERVEKRESTPQSPMLLFPNHSEAPVKATSRKLDIKPETANQA